MLALPGYVEKIWIDAVPEQTGCKIQVKYASSFDDMTTLMRNGGAGVDLVTASGDVGLETRRGRRHRTGQCQLVEGWKNFHAAFKSPATNTFGGRHYGISIEFTPNLLLYNTKRVRLPRSWSASTAPQQGQGHRSGRPDVHRRRGALPREDPSGTRNTRSIRAGRAPVHGSGPASCERSGRWSPRTGRRPPTRSSSSRPVVRRSGRPGRISRRRSRGRKRPIKAASPKEGHHRLARLVDALDEGEAPELRVPLAELRLDGEGAGAAVDRLRRDTGQQEGVPVMDAIEPASCASYRANGPEALLPVDRALEDSARRLRQERRHAACMPYSRWVQAWTEIKG